MEFWGSPARTARPPVPDVVARCLKHERRLKRRKRAARAPMKGRGEVKSGALLGRLSVTGIGSARGGGVTRRRRGAERRHYCGKPVGGSASGEAGGVPRRSPVGARPLVPSAWCLVPACFACLSGREEELPAGCTCQTVTGRVGAVNRSGCSLACLAWEGKGGEVAGKTEKRVEEPGKERRNEKRQAVRFLALTI